MYNFVFSSKVQSYMVNDNNVMMSTYGMYMLLNKYTYISR